MKKQVKIGKTKFDMQYMEELSKLNYEIFDLTCLFVEFYIKNEKICMLKLEILILACNFIKIHLKNG